MVRHVALASLVAALLLTGTLRGSAGEPAIRAPGTVDPGQAVTVMVEGAPPGARVELWVAQAGQGFAARAASADAGQGSAELTAPVQAGSYELRLVDGAGKVLARSVLDVAAIPVTLGLPDPVGAGYDARVQWRGPATPGDMIQIADPETGRVLSEAPATGTAGTLNDTRLRAPETTGQFELRYWHGASATVLRSLPVDVRKGLAFLRAPVEVTVGRPFAVEWVGPASPDQAYELIDPRTEAVLATRPAVGGAGAAGPVQFTAPKKAGKYRLRYVNTGSGFVLADLPLDVDPQ